MNLSDLFGGGGVIPVIGSTPVISGTQVYNTSMPSNATITTSPCYFLGWNVANVNDNNTRYHVYDGSGNEIARFHYQRMFINPTGIAVVYSSNGLTINSASAAGNFCASVFYKTI